MKIFMADSPYDVPQDFINRYKDELKNAYDDVIKLLPFSSHDVNFFVQPREFDLIDVTNDHGQTHNSSFIELAFNPTLDPSAMENILRDVRPTVFHELNHAARYNIPIWHMSFIDDCILEGLATVFAREYTNEKAPWAEYPDNVDEWLQEVIEVGDKIDRNSYMFDHPDGRRWIGYKVGTYIVDRAIRQSGKSILELSSMECAQILELAEIKA